LAGFIEFGIQPAPSGVGEIRSVLVGKARRWLIAPSVLIGLVAQSGATSDVSCFDTSPHKTTFVAVESGVRLEVLDWGGTGDAMVLLTGSGDNAHVYDEFAFQFTDRFHVIGITRRGFGRSSQPARGYDLDTRAHDDIAVLDSLGIHQAVFVGHSIAGTELDRLAATFPGRVAKLVYLDALDIGAGGWSKLAQPPPSPELSASDLTSVQRVAAASARDDGYRKPLAAICNMIRRDPSGRVIGAVTPPEISDKLIAGLQPAVYERIHAPTLGIFNRITPPYHMPYYWALKPAEQAEFDRSIAALAQWTDGAIQRFRSEVKGSRVVEIPNTNHYVYVVEEALVVREMRDFLLGK
jgi:pimeloyl-ACP methyl ester carboxylesterase